jgi:vancomycin aglycone glucosyltransferase
MRYLSSVLVPKLFESVARASQGADMIVGAGVQIAAPSVAEWCDVPYVAVGFCPCVVPSSDCPPPVVQRQTLPRFVNRLLWAVGRPVTNITLRGPINRGRESLDLPGIDSVLSHLVGRTLLVAADRDLGPVGEDAPAEVAVTDAWIWDAPGDLDDRVARFLDIEPAPIYFGFGSMIALDIPTLAGDAVTAARALGRRALIAGGWAGLDRHVRNSDDILAVDAVPHHLVLPRVAVAVHHGGAGTTTAAARAGVPQVILPHILDQFYWAHRIHVLDLGPRGLPVGLVNADVLTDRLSRALGDPRIREAAATFAPAIGSRNGVDAAVELLERL